MNDSIGKHDPPTGPTRNPQGTEEAMPTDEVVLRIYPLAIASPIGEFEPDFLALMSQAISFDSAWMGRTALTKHGTVMHNTCLYRLSPGWPEEFERIKAEDPVLAGRTSPLGRVMRHSITDDDLPATVREAVARHSLMHAMVGVFGDAVLGLHTFVALYRHKLGFPFSDGDADVLQRLMPHVVAATSINRIHHLTCARATPGATHAAIAIADDKGTLQHADEEFARLMTTEWPDWTGPQLPAALSITDLGVRQCRLPTSRVKFQLDALGGGLVRVRARLRMPCDALTERERSVAQMFAQGLSYKEVARTLDLSPATVRHHLRHVYDKLGINDKGQIASMLSRDQPWQPTRSGGEPTRRGGT